MGNGLFDNGLGGFVSGILGSRNKATAGSTQGATQINPNAYNYGGTPTSAAAQANAYGQTAADAANRAAPVTNYTDANGQRQNALNTRETQNQVANTLAAKGMGQGTTVAEILGKQAQQKAISDQTALAGSARGAAGLALASQTAANGIANASGTIAGTTEANAANERLNDLNAAGGILGQSRGQDLTAQGQDAQQSQFNTSAGLQQTGLNDARGLGYSGLQNNVNTVQLQGQAQGQAQQSANNTNAAGINAGVAGQNASSNATAGLGAVGTIGSVATGAATQGNGTPPPKIGTAARGGPVPAHHPYLVGEQGPELVLPRGHMRADGGPVGPGRSPGINPMLVGMNGPEIRTFPHDGMVIPAPQTAQILAPPTWGTGAGMSEPDLARREAGNVAAMNHEQGLDAVRDFGRETYGSPQAFASPIEVQKNRDTDTKATLASKRAHEVEISPDEAREEKVIRYREGGEKKEAAKQTQAALLAPPSMSRGQAVANALGSASANISRQAASGDAGGYHGPNGFINPGAIQIGTRADGGPVEGSQPASVIPAILMRTAPNDFGGSGAVDIGSGGGGISRGQVLAASTGRTGNPMMPVGGGGLVGGSNVPGYSAREDGGPVGPGDDDHLAHIMEYGRPAREPLPTEQSPATAGAPKAGYEAMMVGAPAMMLADAYRRSKAGKSEPEQNMSDMDTAAKIALGPVSGRALIQASTLTPEEIEAAKVRAAPKQAPAPSSTVANLVARFMMGRRQ